MAYHQALAVFMLGVSGGVLVLSPLRMPGVHGETDSLAAHRGSPVMVLVVDARHLGTVRPWARDLHTRYPKLQLLTVADVNEQQPTTVERVAEVLARHVPPEATVLIDMQRVWAGELGLDTAAPNLILVDADGVVTDRFRGRWSKALADEVAQAIAQLGGGA